MGIAELGSADVAGTPNEYKPDNSTKNATIASGFN